jgi:cytoskeletal protein CcmA (bactofilin family)
MAKIQETEALSNGINRICAGTTFVGNIVAAGDIRIDGVLEGNINTRGKLVVGETGRIKGNTICKNADVLGVVEGKTDVSDFLVLRATSRIVGDATMARLLIEVGAMFVGYCNMISNANGAKGEK